MSDFFSWLRSGFGAASDENIARYPLLASKGFKLLESVGCLRSHIVAVVIPNPILIEIHQQTRQARQPFSPSFRDRKLRQETNHFGIFRPCSVIENDRNVVDIYIYIHVEEWFKPTFWNSCHWWLASEAAGDKFVSCISLISHQHGLLMPAFLKQRLPQRNYVNLCSHFTYLTYLHRS